MGKNFVYNFNKLITFIVLTLAHSYINYITKKIDSNELEEKLFFFQSLINLFYLIYLSSYGFFFECLCFFLTYFVFKLTILSSLDSSNLSYFSYICYLFYYSFIFFINNKKVSIKKQLYSFLNIRIKEEEIDTEEFIDDTIATFLPYEDKIRQLLFKHNPAKLVDVVLLLKKYKGNEKALYQKLLNKYEGGNYNNIKTRFRTSDSFKERSQALAQTISETISNLTESLSMNNSLNDPLTTLSNNLSNSQTLVDSLSSTSSSSTTTTSSCISLEKNPDEQSDLFSPHFSSTSIGNRMSNNFSSLKHTENMLELASRNANMNATLFRGNMQDNNTYNYYNNNIDTEFPPTYNNNTNQFSSSLPSFPPTKSYLDDIHDEHYLSHPHLSQSSHSTSYHKVEPLDEPPQLNTSYNSRLTSLGGSHGLNLGHTNISHNYSRGITNIPSYPGSSYQFKYNNSEKLKQLEKMRQLNNNLNNKINSNINYNNNHNLTQRKVLNKPNLSKNHSNKF